MEIKPLLSNLLHLYRLQNCGPNEQRLFWNEQSYTVFTYRSSWRYIWQIKSSRFPFAFEESADWALLSSFCDDSYLRVSVFKQLHSTGEPGNLWSGDTSVEIQYIAVGKSIYFSSEDNLERQLDICGLKYAWLWICFHIFTLWTCSCYQSLSQWH